MSCTASEGRDSLWDMTVRMREGSEGSEEMFKDDPIWWRIYLPRRGMGQWGITRK